MKFITPLYFRNFIFGVEDSLVSTVGLLSGIAIAGVPRETIFLTGVVLILVEALSMAAGSFLSESSAEELAAGGVVPVSKPFAGGSIMFVSYFLAGFVPLVPYVLFTTALALPVSIAASLAALFLLGAVSGAISRAGIVRRAVRMFLVGGLAIVAGMLAGAVLSLQTLI